MNQTIDQQSVPPVAACPLCASDRSEIIAHQLRRGTGAVQYCAACDHGFLVQNQVLDVKEFYDKLYRQEFSHNAEAVATNAREIFQVYKNYQQDRLHHVSPILTAGTRLLEVGASSGQFLTHIKDRVAVVNAIELDKACCAFLGSELGIERDDEFLENSRFAGQTYDIVCAFQVIEHVEQPVAFLKTLRQAAKRGGTIFIEAPNLRDPLLSVWGVHNYHKFYYHSAHLHYFTEASLRKVAQEAGFSSDQIEIDFIQDYNVLNHLHWIMNDAPQADCHPGLSEINLRGQNHEIAAWMTDELRAINRKYIAKLVAAKCTSNLFMKLRHE